MENINRRLFITIGGMGLVNAFLSRDFVAAQSDVRPRGSAGACIFINLFGAPSHVDTFDVKPGRWTPPDFDIADFGNIRLSRKLFPNLGRHASDIAIVRSFRAWGVEHGQAQYALTAARQFNPGFVSEVPHIGSVISLEAALRGETGPFPSFISFNAINETRGGFVADKYGIRHNPFVTLPTTPDVAHPAGRERFQSRWEFLQSLDRELRQPDPSRGEAINVFPGLYQQAKDLTHFQPFEEAFTINEQERQRYGSTTFGDSCIVARKILAARRGTRFITINHSGDSGVSWDHHANIYDQANLPALCRETDQGLSALLSDMKQLRISGSRTLLDDTLIIVMGEFGRTAGDLNETGGRDHHPVSSALFVGGGVAGNQIIGRTDSEGRTIVDTGWGNRPASRPTRIEDIGATIYSALGINWTREVTDTPSGRAYLYTQYSPDGEHGPVPVFKETPPKLRRRP